MSSTKTATKTTTKTVYKYSPTTEELTIAVRDILKKDKTLEWKAIQELLGKKKKDNKFAWDVPDRRVQKFVKRQKVDMGLIPKDDDSVFSFFSKGKTAAKPAANGKTSATGPKKTGAAAATSATAKPRSGPQGSTVARSSSVTNVKRAPGEAAVRSASVKRTSSTRNSKVNAYMDDNDGKKNNFCWCCAPKRS